MTMNKSGLLLSVLLLLMASSLASWSEIVVYANGDKYDGEFKNGNFNGRGVYTCANGDIYNGEWKDGNYVS